MTTMEDLERLSKAATPEQWAVPHFAVEDHGCRCGYVFSSGQSGMGAIATIHHRGDKTDGAHENEPDDVAKANARLIVALVNAYRSGDLIHKDRISEDARLRPRSSEVE